MKPNAPVLLVVPEINPVGEALKPGGNMSVLRPESAYVKEYGGVPPTAVICCEYGTFVVAVFKPLLKTANGDTFSVKVRRNVAPRLSVATKSKLYAAAAVGAPCRYVRPTVWFDEYEFRDVPE
jgi:hypothetical protein